MDVDSDESDVYMARVKIKIGAEVMKSHKSNSVESSRTNGKSVKNRFRTSTTDRCKLSFGDEDNDESDIDNAVCNLPTVQRLSEKKNRRKDGKKPRRSCYGFGGYQNPTLLTEQETHPDDEYDIISNVSSHTGFTVHDFDRPLHPPQGDSVGIHSKGGEKDGLSSYGKESLSKLISEQKMYTSTEHQEMLPTTHESQDACNRIGISHDHHDFVNNSDFIPLNSSNSTFDPIILTGDEILYHGIESDENSDTERLVAGDNPESLMNRIGRTDETAKPNHSIGNNCLDEDGNDWEETIARRAGLQQKEYVGKATWSGSDEPSKVEERGQILTKIKNSIKSTIISLEGRNSNLQQQIVRKRQEYDLLQSEILKQTSEQTTMQKKFDYYQVLRTKLITWVGCLRDSNPKLVLIEDAFRELSRERAVERHLSRKEWEEDVYHIISTEPNMLDRVMGKIPTNTNNIVGVSMTDEFGRDIGSINRFARNKRKSKRQKRQRENRLRLDEDTPTLSSMMPRVVKDSEDSDFAFDDEDLMNTEERRKALSDAVDAVLVDLDEEYTSVSQLIAIFKDWISCYADDFDNCYATLSLAEMVLVFARFEMCSKLDLMGHMMEIKPYKNLNLHLEYFQWFLSLSQLTDAVKTCETYVKDFVIHNSCIPYFVFTLSPVSDSDTMLPGPYDWFSYRQTQKLTSFYSSLCLALSSEHDTLYMKPVLESLWSHFRAYVDDRPIILLHSKALDDWMGSVHLDMDSEKFDAIAFAAFGQIYYWKKIISNCCGCWAPILQKSDSIVLAKMVLQYVFSARLVPLLTVLGNMENVTVHDVVRSVVSEVYQCILKTQWLEMEELMDYSAPLRAIRYKYSYE